MAKYVDPAIDQTAFSCPHCGALTTQTWSRLYSEQISSEQRTPFRPDGLFLEDIESDSTLGSEEKTKLKTWLKRVTNGEVFLDEVGAVRPDAQVVNLDISQCFNCNALAIWLHDRLLFPGERAQIEPNEDLSDEIKRDFNEARSILDASPRGAAALLRLALQKLCAQLGESGKNIDNDIASLVGKGLNPLIQKSLDVVRVIGNEAVHPGTVDLRDDRATAVQLFKVINSIADQMITHPKHVDALYKMLPEEKRAGIDQRNRKALEKK